MFNRIEELYWSVAEMDYVFCFFIVIWRIFMDDHQKSCINRSEDSTVHCRVVDRCDVWKIGEKCWAKTMRLNHQEILHLKFRPNNNQYWLQMFKNNYVEEKPERDVAMKRQPGVVEAKSHEWKQEIHLWVYTISGYMNVFLELWWWSQHCFFLFAACYPLFFPVKDMLVDH